MSTVTSDGPTCAPPPSSPPSTPDRPASATSAIPATSCGWSCGGSAAVVLGAPRRHRHLDRRRRHRRPRPCGQRVADAVRELLLVLTQVLARRRAGGRGGAAGGPAALAAHRRCSSLAAAAGAAVVRLLLDPLLDLPGRLPDALTGDTWVASTRFPSLPFLAGAAAAAMVGKPWLSRSWRRAADVAVARRSLVVMAIAGSAGVPELRAGASPPARPPAPPLLVVFGAPNRRPTPAAVASRSRAAGLDLDRPRSAAGRRRPDPALRRRHRRRRRRVPQGVLPRQPRRRRAVPRLPRRAAPRGRPTRGRRSHLRTTSRTRRSS